MTTYIPEKPCKRGHQLRYKSNDGCVECAKARNARWYKAGYHKEYQSKWLSNPVNKAKRNEWHDKWVSRPDNKAKQREWERQWRRNPVNKAKRNAIHQQRIKHRRLGDKWDNVLIWIYLDRPEGYVCDHIDPLDGTDRSGLHTPWNLQYLKRGENSFHKKSLTEYEAKSAISIDWEQYINKPLP